MNVSTIPNAIAVQLADLIALKRFVTHKILPIQGKKIQNGSHLSKWRGRGMDFAETRHYQIGDEIRHMEWKITARTGRPHIKVFEEEKERPVFIVVDFNPSMYFGSKSAFKSVIAAKLAALIAWTVSKEGDRLGGCIYRADTQQVLMPKARNLGLMPFLETLSAYTKAYKEGSQGRPYLLSEALSRVRRIHRPGSIIVLVSDFYSLDAVAKEHLSLLCEHNDLLAYHIHDPLELAPPKPGIYPLIDGEEEYFLNTHKASVTQAYQAWCTKRMQALTDVFQKLKIDYNLVSGEDSLPHLVHKTFPRRKRV